MKRQLSRVILILFLLVQMLPVAFAVEADKTMISVEMPQKPYERVIASSGNWYSEQLTFENDSELVTAWDSEYVMEESYRNMTPVPMAFNIREPYVLGSIVIPYSMKAAENVRIMLKDSQGNLYGPFTGVQGMANVSTARESVNKDNSSELGVGEALATDADAVNYVFTPSTQVRLDKGAYEMTLNLPDGQVRNAQTGPSGAYLLKGFNADGYERYEKELKELGMDSKMVKGEAVKGEAEEEILGSEGFIPDSLKDYKYLPGEKPPKKKKALFKLEEESLLASVVFNTYNDGKGEPPGTIAILDSKGVTIAAFESTGKALGGIPNGAWLTIPNLILPAGTYEIGMSKPESAKYDKQGRPEFFVTIEDPPVGRVDFTGTYKSKFDAFKRSTLMGPVTDNDSDFSVKDFELTILDKNGELELIGTYQNIPFSQACTIVEEKSDKVVAIANFDADLTNLPAQTHITAEFMITLTQKGNKPAKFSLQGNGTYQRAATKTKGADNNTYELKGMGTLETREIPPYVATAIGKATKGAGNVPGPDSAGAAAVGLLFPPLVGLVVHVLQELLKPKPEVPKIKKYTKEWYKQQNPNMTDEQIGWAMLADAMGNSDEPDADPESGGGSSGGSSSSGEGSEGSSEGGSEGGSDSGDSDGGSSEGDSEAGDSEGSSSDSDADDSGSSGDDGSSGDTGDSGDSGDSEAEEEASDYDDYEEAEEEAEDEYGDDEDSEEDSEDESDEETDGGSDDSTQSESEGSKGSSSESKEGQETEGGSEASEEDEGTTTETPEPETMTLQVDHTGRTAEYVKDPETGEWINPETGGILDLERYERDVKPNFEKDKAFIDGEREKLEKGETAFDKQLREQAAAQKQAAQREAYLDKLADKYGTRDEAELKQIISENNSREQANSESWQKIGNALEVAETTASVVGIVADNAVDGLAAITGPAGAEVRAVYKVTKSIASSMAENGVNASSFVAGAVKGGADAATDFIDGTKTKIFVTIAGEVVGGGIQEGSWDGAKSGAVGGVSKVLQGAIIDKIGGGGYGREISTMNLGNGQVRVAINSGSKWVGRNVSEGTAMKFISKKLTDQGYQTAVKTVGSLLDEFAVKPNITTPIQDSLKSSN